MSLRFRSTILCLVLVASVASPAMAQRYTGQGTVVGGATGAVIGGLIGKQDGHTTGGALIGGAVGALAGGMMGKNYDNQLARQEYVHQQAMYAQQQQIYTQQQQQQYAAAQSGVTMADVVSMSRSGVSDSVIMAQLQSRGVQRKLEVSDIIGLHQQGVSDALISAMQAAPLSAQMGASPSYAARNAYSQPVMVQPNSAIVVQEPVIVSGPPVIYRPHCHPHYHSHGHHHGGISIGYGF